MSRDAYIVVVDNGDTEPELWGFDDSNQADSFAAYRGGEVQSITIMDTTDGHNTIVSEREGI